MGLSCEQGPPPKRTRSKEAHEEEDAVGSRGSVALAAARGPDSHRRRTRRCVRGSKCRFGKRSAKPAFE